jgi:hypothetical protein
LLEGAIQDFARLLLRREIRVCRETRSDGLGLRRVEGAETRQPRLVRPNEMIERGMNRAKKGAAILLPVSVAAAA